MDAGNKLHIPIKSASGLVELRWALGQKPPETLIIIADQLPVRGVYDQSHLDELLDVHGTCMPLQSMCRGCSALSPCVIWMLSCALRAHSTPGHLVHFELHASEQSNLHAWQAGDQRHQLRFDVRSGWAMRAVPETWDPLSERLARTVLQGGHDKLPRGTRLALSAGDP